MADIVTTIVSYNDCKNQSFQGDDHLGIFSYTQTEERIKTFFSNPNLEDYDSPMVNLSIVDGVIAGRSMSFPTKVKFYDTILPCTTGSSLEVNENYRHYDIGVDLVLKPVRNKDNKQLLYADFSKEGIGMYKAARFNIFQLSVLMQARRVDVLLQMIGLKGWLLRLLSLIGSLFLNSLLFFIDKRTSIKANNLEIEETNIVPEWVDDITLNDGHQFMEVHDHRWLQWCLDNMFHYHLDNKNRFFTVKKDEKPIGFFMFKERHSGIAVRNIKDMVMTTVVEWGSKDMSLFDEVMANRLSAMLCSKKTGIVRIATDNTNTLKKCKRGLFFRHGSHYIVHKDNTKQYKETKDQSLWRLRFGYSDSIFN